MEHSADRASFTHKMKSKRAAFIRLEEAAKRLGKGLWSPP